MPKHVGYETAREHLARGCYSCGLANRRKLGCGHSCTLLGSAPPWDRVRRQCSRWKPLPQPERRQAAAEVEALTASTPFASDCVSAAGRIAAALASDRPAAGGPLSAAA